MRINGFKPGSVSPNRSGPSESSRHQSSPASDEIRIAPVDRAEISDEAMNLARRALEVEATRAGMESDRFQAVLERVDSGFYKQQQVVDEVARRLALSGDL